MTRLDRVRDPDLARDVGWEPRVHGEFDPTRREPAIVALHAGPFTW
jgi:hypothetical protein